MSDLQSSQGSWTSRPFYTRVTIVGFLVVATILLLFGVGVLRG